MENNLGICPFLIGELGPGPLLKVYMKPLALAKECGLSNNLVPSEYLV